MTEQKEIPVRFRVAEAGFGAMMENHGFRMVPRGRCHWRKDGEGITWRVAIRQENIQDDQGLHWIDVYYGCEVHGADALQAKLTTQKISARMPGTSAPVHRVSNMLAWVVHAYQQKQKEIHLPKTRLGKILYHLHPFGPPSFESWFDIPFVRLVPYNAYYGFCFADNELIPATRQLCDLFQTHCMPQIQAINSIEELHDDWFGPESQWHGKSMNEVMIVAKLAGRQEHIELIAKNEINRNSEAFEHIRKRITPEYDPDKEQFQRNEFTLDEWTTVIWLNRLAMMHNFLREADALGFDVQQPNLDLTPYLRAKDDWGPDEYYPDLKTRRAMKKRGEDWTMRYR